MDTTVSRPTGLGVPTSVTPRERVRSAGDVLRLIGGLLLVAVGMSVAAGARSTIRGIEQDVARGVGYLPDRVEEALFGLALVIAVALPVLAIVVLLVRRRFAFVVSLVLASWLAASVMATLASALVDWGVLARDAAADSDVGFGDPRFATSPLIASTVAIVVIASPRVPVRWRRVLWGLVALLVVARLVGATEPPLDIVVALGIGLAVGALVLLVVGTPSFDPDGPELVRMLRDAGVEPTAVEQIDSPTGSLTYRVCRAGQHPLVLRLRTPHDRSADLLERLWRRLRARPTTPGHRLSSTKRHVEREALALTVARMGRGADAAPRGRGGRAVRLGRAGAAGDRRPPAQRAGRRPSGRLPHRRRPRRRLA